ncbi:MAG: branched-chain amino acid ABC transporter permease [Thermodesulfobacteriota bacterium]
MDLIESYQEELKLVRRTWTKVWVLALVAAAFLLPLYAPEHIVYLAAAAAFFGIGVLGQNLLIGYTGQISFGQAGFLCLGAFTYGHLARLGAPWPLSLLAAGLVAGLFGLLVGFPSLRLKGPYLAIATMGFGIAVYQVFVNSPLLSGGRMGLTVQKLQPLFGLSQTNFYYYFNLLFCLGFILLTYNIVSSYLGRAFIAIRDNDIAAEVLGVNLTRYKLLSFAISSFYVGVQGGLMALFLGYLEPNMFTFFETINFLVAVIVGGLASVEGAIMGAVFVVFVPQVFSAYKELVSVVFGIAIMIVLIFEPGGMAGRWIKMRLYFANWPFR